MSQGKPCKWHKWKTNDVSWSSNEPAGSREVEVLGYCEVCELEVKFRYELEGTYDTEDDLIELEGYQ